MIQVTKDTGEEKNSYIAVYPDQSKVIIKETLFTQTNQY